MIKLDPEADVAGIRYVLQLKPASEFRRVWIGVRKASAAKPERG